MDTRKAPTAYQRTLDAKPTDHSIVKPGELVDIVEMSPLTLTDRRIYNLLLANAWDGIAEEKQHVIPKRELVNSFHKGTDRLEDSITRLMGAVVQIRVIEDGKPAIRRVQLLGGNTNPDAENGLFRYDFHSHMREIITESVVFARLHKKIMFALSSKYSLALYEMIQKRGNMNRTFEEISIADFRNFLGVPKGKLLSWINFKNVAITPAIAEVSDLSDFIVTIEPIKTKGKQFTGVRLIWERKEPKELSAVERELEFSKVGRRARMKGTVETTELGQSTSFTPALHLKPDTFDKVRKACPGFDPYYLEAEWRAWSVGKSTPDNADAAFIAFSKKHAESNPLDG